MKTKQFTLVELIVVVAIVAIFAGMLLPALDGDKMKAREVACTNNQKQAFSAIQLYAGDNDNFLFSGNSHAYPFNKTTTNMTWAQRLQVCGYIKESAQVVCPTSGDSSYWATYGVPYFSDAPHAFSLSTMAKGMPIGKFANGGVSSPATVVLVADSGRTGSENQCFRLTTKYDGSGVVHTVHEDKANVVYFDGHAGTVAENEVGKTLSLMAEDKMVFVEYITKYLDGFHETKTATL